MTSPPAFDVALTVLVGMVLIWFVLIKLLCLRLEEKHESKYLSMGRPSLCLRNNFESTWAILKFILGREHSALNDGYLSRLSDFMLGFFVVYLVMFVSLPFLGG